MLKRTILLRITFITQGLMFFIASNLEAQWTEWAPSIEDTIEIYDDLFGREEVLNLTLKSDFKTFRRTRSKDIYLPAEMSCQVSDSFQVSHPVRLKARGIYRKENCSMPPIWLNIRYSGIQTRELSGIRRIKMVTMCRSGDQYSNYLLREYLVYKIYNLVTPYSYRVRLIKFEIGG